MIPSVDNLVDRSGFVPIWRTPYRQFKGMFPHQLRAGAMAFWVEALVRANFQDGYFEGEILKRGQLLFGRDELAADIGLSPSQVRTIVRHLEKLGEMTTRTTSRGTIATIQHYEIYAAQVERDDQPHRQHIASTSPAHRHSEETNKLKSQELLGGGRSEKGADAFEECYRRRRHT